MAKDFVCAVSDLLYMFSGLIYNVVIKAVFDLLDMP